MACYLSFCLKKQLSSYLKECAANEGYQLTIDLAAQEVRTPTGEAFKFEVDPFRKHCLLNGLDDIGFNSSKCRRNSCL